MRAWLFLAVVVRAIRDDECVVSSVSTEVKGPMAVSWGDMNGDGLTDLIVASSEDGHVLWYEAPGYGRHEIDTEADNCENVAVGDMNNDGEMDLVVAARDIASFLWYENLGDGNEWKRHVISATANGARSVYLADIDGDGLLDVIAGSTGDNSLQWYANGAKSENPWPWRLITDGERKARSVWAGDLDNDGKLEIVSTSEAFHRVDIFWHVIDGFVETQLPNDDFPDPRYVHGADVDGDGTVDLIVADAKADDITVYYLSEDSFPRRSLQASTDAPSPEPTDEPTVKPSLVPTDEPTAKPSLEPTLEPTVTPTYKPTFSVEPSLEPTLAPVPKPTTKPTTTMAPSTTTTSEPSPKPTAKPTWAPTAKPTSVPSAETATLPPSLVPTYRPTILSTTAKPTRKPTQTDAPVARQRDFTLGVVDDEAPTANVVYAVDVDGDGKAEIFGAYDDHVAAYSIDGARDTFHKRLLHSGPKNIQALTAYVATMDDADIGGEYFIAFASKDDDEVFIATCWAPTPTPTFIPTYHPTSMPSLPPTTGPKPSYMPSSQPSVTSPPSSVGQAPQPSAIDVSLTPTTVPHYAPTASPSTTVAPTVAPVVSASTTSPTTKPTLAPVAQTTMSPTSSPSSAPSALSLTCDLADAGAVDYCDQELHGTCVVSGDACTVLGGTADTSGACDNGDTGCVCCQNIPETGTTKGSPDSEEDSSNSSKSAPSTWLWIILAIILGVLGAIFLRYSCVGCLDEDRGYGKGGIEMSTALSDDDEDPRVVDEEQKSGSLQDSNDDDDWADFGDADNIAVDTDNPMVGGTLIDD